MEFNETLLQESYKFRKEYPELINLGIDIDEYLISIFNSTFSDKYHQSLLRLVNAFRRNFLLSSFLFESKQGNVWVQAMRTMIESWELVCVYLFEPQLVYDDILNSNGRPTLDLLIKKYVPNWITKLKNNSIADKAKWIFDTKTTINNLLTHVNPSYNLRFASAFDFSVESQIVAWYTDPDDGQSLNHYIFLVSSFLELTDFISSILPITNWNSFLSPDFQKIPDFHLEKYLEKYVPHWLKT